MRTQSQILTWFEFDQSTAISCGSFRKHQHLAKNEELMLFTRRALVSAALCIQQKEPSTDDASLARFGFCGHVQMDWF